MKSHPLLWLAMGIVTIAFLAGCEDDDNGDSAGDTNAAPAALDVTGTWRTIGDSPEPPGYLILVQRGDEVWGAVSGGMVPNTFPLQGTVSGSNLWISTVFAPDMGADIEATAAVTDRDMTGTWTQGGDSGPFAAVRENY